MLMKVNYQTLTCKSIDLCCNMFSIIKNVSTKSCDEMEEDIDAVTSIEESGRGCRSKKRQIDPTCCPVCSITLRVSELDSHLVTEIDKLSKLSVKHKRNSKWTPPSSSSSTDTLGKGWETYQRVKVNRQVRLKVKSKKRKNDEITCPVCNQATSEDISVHVEMCLQRVEKLDDTGSEDENIDVEGFEEYEWAGQTRIRASSLLEGGFASTGIGTSVSKSSAEEEDTDVIVDGDDSTYGSPQYTDQILKDLIDAKQTSIEEKENCVMQTQSSMDTNCSEINIDTNCLSLTVVDALKSKIRELEARDQNKELYKCLICMGVYVTPVVSICCWHVHCEQCWLKTLATKKLCPQCNMITSPLDLRKIYI